MKKRIICLALCLILAVGLLPTAVLGAKAIHDHSIGNVAITVAAPAVGEAPAKPELSTEGPTLYAYEWYEGDSRFGYLSETFRAGHTYRLQVRVSVLDTLGSFKDDTTATVNGQEAVVKDWEAQSLLFYYDFVLAAPKLTGIRMVTPPDKSEYTAGEPIDTTGMILAATYDDGSERVLSPEECHISDSDRDKLEYRENRPYFYVYLNDTQYYVAVPIKVNPAPQVTKTVLKSVSVTVTPPAVGEHPDYTVKVNTPGCHVDATFNTAPHVKGVAWAVTTAKDALTAGDPMTASDVFEAGKYYGVVVALKPDEGYQFYQTVVGGPSLTTVTVNGEAAFVISAPDGLMAGRAFDALQETPAEKRTLVSLSITKAPEKLSYVPGDSVDLKGMEVTAAYSDGSSAVVKDFKILPSGALEAGTTSFTVSYTEDGITKTAAQTIKVTYAAAPQPELSNPFADVKAEDYFYDAVLWAFHAQPQVTNGVDATHFGPLSAVTRGQAVTFLWRAAGCPEPGSMATSFVDVGTTDYFYKPVLWAVDHGITNGTDDSHFSPDLPLTQAHIVTFLYRVAGSPGAAPNPLNEWYTDAMDWAYSIHLFHGMDKTDVGALDPCPRADVVCYLYRQMAK